MSCNISSVYMSENVQNMVYDLHFRLKKLTDQTKTNTD